jgi:hypothetical protein
MLVNKSTKLHILNSMTKTNPLKCIYRQLKSRDIKFSIMSLL